jgi:hypothetical protein
MTVLEILMPQMREDEHESEAWDKAKAAPSEDAAEDELAEGDSGHRRTKDGA